MTQRIFDIKNEKDMQDLWDILPDNIIKLTPYKFTKTGYDGAKYHDETGSFIDNIIAINWHDATEITRPVDYEKMIGCVGWFWDEYEETSTIGILTEYKQLLAEPFVRNSSTRFSNLCPAKKSELKFLEDKE